MNPAEKYILDSPEPFRSILVYLKTLIEQEVPNTALLYKWNLPFYYIGKKQPFCYLNHTKGYVDMVFWHGAHLTQYKNHLISDGRKHMKSLRYYTLEEVDEKIVVEILKEAYAVKDKKYYK
ncbi:DUF1801 domain-containing protein [Marixanthomonas spongiae]|uniref:2-dehydro-3-deoxyphosphooctonate aldolase n=1 Tax=Marixanthomonas spongiae TaxID=2174845 RepID=A0A2U0I5A6_9FLAO|nr:DUF1801 domain-containing protein [Marixanthomonas spongiae]PVW16282.1 2-dehydro-3-deoxyphosphooctonate aldolase [Marixanthomonas spongiae]